MSRVMPVVLVVLVILGFPAGAAAGGWATVGLSSLPDATAPGGIWVVDIEVRQHGLHPLAGVRPAVVVRGAGGAERRFAARPTGRTGSYRARVPVPTAGTFAYEVDDGFGGRHAFAPVRIAGPAEAPAAGGGDPEWLPMLGAALAGLAAAAAAAAAVVRRRPALRTGA